MRESISYIMYVFETNLVVKNKLLLSSTHQFAENQLSGPITSDLVNNLVNLKIFSVHNREEGKGKHNGTIPRFDHHPYLAEI